MITIEQYLIQEYDMNQIAFSSFYIIQELTKKTIPDLNPLVLIKYRI